VIGVCARLRGVTPNPRMQPTGRMGAELRSGKRSVSALWNEGLSGRRLEGLQLMRISLGRLARPEPLAEHDPVESSATSTEAQAL